LLEERFTPQNIYSKTEVKLKSVQEFEEVREGDYSEQEEDTNGDEEVAINLRSKLSPKEIEDYVNSLKAAAVHWYNTHNPVNNPDLPSDESLWIDRLNRMGIIYFRPLVTAAYLNKNISSEKRVEMFRNIERFIFVAFRLSRSASSYRNSEFYRAARQLRNNGLNADDIIHKMNSQMSFCFYVPEHSDQAYFNY